MAIKIQDRLRVKDANGQKKREQNLYIPKTKSNKNTCSLTHCTKKQICIFDMRSVNKSNMYNSQSLPTIASKTDPEGIASVAKELQKTNLSSGRILVDLQA